MRLKPENLEAAYEYLRSTLPFRRWNLPPGDEVEFHVTRHKSQYGDHELLNGRHIIRISETKVGRTQSLIETMSHEMVHAYCDRRGVRAEHGREFKRCAALVCRHHGFDEHAF